MLGISRSAVAGRARRLDLPRRAGTLTKDEVRRRRAAREQARWQRRKEHGHAKKRPFYQNTVHKPKERQAPKPLPAAPLLPPTCEPVRLIDMRNYGVCQYIIDETTRGPDTLKCSAPTEGGKSYCEFHYRRMYYPPTPAKERRARKHALYLAEALA